MLIKSRLQLQGHVSEEAALAEKSFGLTLGLCRPRTHEAGWQQQGYSPAASPDLTRAGGMGVAVTSTSSEPACLGPTGPVAWGCAVLGKSPELSEPIFSLCVSGDNPTAPQIQCWHIGGLGNAANCVYLHSVCHSRGNSAQRRLRRRGRRRACRSTHQEWVCWGDTPPTPKAHSCFSPQREFQHPLARDKNTDLRIRNDAALIRATREVPSSVTQTHKWNILLKWKVKSLQ